MLGRAEICQLLPHSESMCLLETVETWNEEEIVCIAHSHREPGNPLRRGDVLPAVVGIEYAAQAMGVHGRLVARNRSKPAVGYLVSLRDVMWYAERLDDAPGPLTIHARRVAGSGNSVLCEFSLNCADAKLVSGRATLFLEK